MCSTSRADKDRDNVILSVREFPSCHYILTVSTPLLCGHPAFRPPVGWVGCAVELMLRFGSPIQLPWDNLHYALLVPP
jgi:hypothetical protein